MNAYSAFAAMRGVTETRACNCVGPRDGAPVCPCAMPGYLRQQRANQALELLERLWKPRVRVKAGRREIA